MLERREHLERVKQLLRQFPVVGLIGARQVGKTTMARALSATWHTGAELDLLVVRGGRRFGFEVKRTDAPRVTAAMRSAISTLGLERLDVLHAGVATFALAESTRAVAVSRLIEDLEPLR
ncbi:MAG: hypothetical protein HYU51_19515 [Candidatus Rokubacteria bacterium]|nr:hypothetical protein [Candidatus Rokubacteria bacterium]